MDDSNRELYYEGLIEQIMLSYGDHDWNFSELPQEYHQYCESVSEEHRAQKEIKEFLLACGYVTEKVITHAWSETALGVRSSDTMFDKNSIMALGLWHRGVVANVTQRMGDLYQALLRWWKRMCRAVRSMTRIELEEASGSAIALMTDLTLAQRA